MASSLLLDQVASSVASRDWERVCGLLSRADERDALDATALEALAEALWWLGRVNACIEARSRALDHYEQLGDRTGAARIALLLSEDHRRQGRGVVAESWRRRAARLLEGQPESAEHGYLHLYQAEVARRNGQLDAGRVLLADALAIAGRVGDVDLAADVTQETGRLLIASGAHPEGLAMMDEAMLTATEGRLNAYTTGKIYCCLMSACDELGDVGRVAEWEQSSADWSRADGVNVFPGMCRVHHADVLAHHGRWSEAEREAERACDELREVGWIVAFAYITIGQIRRRRGDLAGAAGAFADAEKLGITPEAGLSMLLLEQGNAQGAMRRISRALAETPLVLERARLLPTLIEIAIASGELDAAASAIIELDKIVAAYGTPKLQATATLARTRMCLARNDWVSACSTAATTLRQWHELAAPYEVATARVLHARACHALDDHDGWTTSLDIAASIFSSLGATADLTAVNALRDRRRASTARPGGGSLTARELVVLRLVATGATNKTIASELVVSQKTVARHLSNIFTKLGVSTRAAATAYAFNHDLVQTG